MNTQEKKDIQKTIEIIIEGIEFKTKGIFTARDEYRKAMNDLLKSGSETYSQIYLDRKTKEIKDGFKTKMQTKHDELVTSLEQLRKLIQERDQVLDLSNPALTNALTLIQAIGSDMSYEESERINQNFRNDQSALRALRSAYKANHVIMTGSIDQMIYNVNDAINDLLVYAEAGTLMDSTMNEFAGKFSKLAALEGMTTETTPDQIGMEEAMWKAAGLTRPVKSV